MEDSEILLKIRRQFTKDECVQSLLKEISSIKFKNGELLSEIEELKHELDELKKRKGKRELTKDDIFLELTKGNQTLRKKNNDLMKRNMHLKNQYLQLLLHNKK